MIGLQQTSLVFLALALFTATHALGQVTVGVTTSQSGPSTECHLRTTNKTQPVFPPSPAEPLRWTRKSPEIRPNPGVTQRRVSHKTREPRWGIPDSKFKAASSTSGGEPMIRLQQTSEAFLHQHPAFPSQEDRIRIRRDLIRETLVTSLRVVKRQKLTQGVFHLPLIEEDQTGSAFLLDPRSTPEHEAP
ncbi:MAG: hypothetical protein RL095_1471 [Verrucomicrobiota bacterium]